MPVFFGGSFLKSFYMIVRPQWDMKAYPSGHIESAKLFNTGIVEKGS